MNELPESNLSPEEFRNIVIQAINRHDSSFQFTEICRYFLESIDTQKIGTIQTNDYFPQKSLNQKDKNKIREILWDFIIDRILTIGGYHDNEDKWPHLSFTQNGKRKLLKLISKADK